MSLEKSWISVEAVTESDHLCILKSVLKLRVNHYVVFRMAKVRM